MARAVHDQSEQSDRDDRIRDRLDSYFATMGMGFNAYLERRNRMEEMRRLSALPDDELQALGVTRADIPAHVFRDLFDL